MNSPRTPEDPAAQRERFFGTVPSSSCNKDRRTDHDVGNTIQEVKNKDVTDRKRRTEQDGGEFNKEKKKSAYSEPQLTTKTSPQSISCSTTSSNYDKKPNKVYIGHSKSPTTNCSKALSTQSQTYHRP